MDLNQGSSVKIDRLTLGPDAEHWGVHRVADGSFQRFSAAGNRDRFTRLLESRTDKIKSNSQIGFVALGFSGDWAFSVNGHIEQSISNHENVNTQTIVLSPFARVWIIVWEDGTLSHNLPFNIASQVEDYCQLQHSLKSNGNQSNPGRPKAPKAKPPRNNQQASNSPTQQQQPTPKSTQNTNATAKLNTLANATQSLARQVSQTTNRQRNGASAPGFHSISFYLNQQPTARQAPAQPPKLLQVSKAPAVTQPASQVALTRAGLQQAPRVVPSQTDRSISRVETISAKPRVCVPPKKLSTTLRQLDVTDWKDSDDYNKRWLATSAFEAMSKD
ncbi:hypothetical protein FRC04_006985 [Tulasnella sp. 424]|nr:hypothetical protein FRC04_006985 [Tulasnella sp. 424]